MAKLMRSASESVAFATAQQGATCRGGVFVERDGVAAREKMRACVLLFHVELELCRSGDGRFNTHAEPALSGVSGTVEVMNSARRLLIHNDGRLVLM